MSDYMRYDEVKKYVDDLKDLKFEIFSSGMDYKQSEILYKHVRYGENKAKLCSIVNDEVAKNIIQVIEYHMSTISSRNESIEKSIEAILSGANLSEVKSMKDIRAAFIKSKIDRRFKTDYKRLSELKKEPERSGLEKYSTSQLKAELRRRKGK